MEGSLWSLAGAMLYAVYIVMIKRRVDREDKLDIPMFFGKEMPGISLAKVPYYEKVPFNNNIF